MLHMKDDLESALDTLPVPVRVRDIVLGPVHPKSSKTKIMFSASDVNAPLGHMRWSEAGPQSISEISQYDGEPVVRIDEPCIYAGPIIYHFGHMIAECIHRLWARQEFSELRNSKVSFHAKPDIETPDWLLKLLPLCGLSVEDVIFIDRPTYFRELHIPEQGRLLGGRRGFDAYPSLLPLADIVPDRSFPKVYISRKTHMHSGSYFGESYIERFLASKGYEIIYPETVTPSALTAILAGAEKAVFAEGSAIHHMELCGRVDADVFVIGRRGGATERFRHVLADVCKNWTVYDASHSPVSLFYHRGLGRIDMKKGNSFLDLEHLADRLNQFECGTVTPFDADLAKLCEAADVARYLTDTRSYYANSTPEQKAEVLDAVLRAEAVKHLFSA